MNTLLEVLFTPAEFNALTGRDLSTATCVVLDVLRATTSMVAALANGARDLRPVAEIPEALELRRQDPDVLLAGERGGVRIRADVTGSVDFDLGNSPREFTTEAVRGRRIVISTTNGTRALRACVRAQAVWIGCFRNLGAVARLVARQQPPQLLIVGSGTLEQAAYEDTLAAGALCEAVWSLYSQGVVADSAQIARALYLLERADLPAAVRKSRNARRLLGRPELAEDVPFCLEQDVVDLVPVLHADGSVRCSRDL